MKSCIRKRSKFISLLKAIILAICLVHVSTRTPTTEASLLETGKNYVYDWVTADDSKPVTTLSIIEISDMRVRDIKRRLTREHGYGADEIAKMIDKKELINALSYEEHRTEQKEKERKKRVALRRSIIVALICVIVVMFKPLFVHAWEVICVNIEVYTDKKKYEFSRIVEFRSPKAAFGLLLTIGVNCLQFWLSASVLLSWVMKSEYFFPIPHIPIRPAALLATATGNTGGAGPLGSYGINVGPMVVSWLFRFTNGKIENFMGRALADAHKKQKKKMKAARKEQEKKEAAIAKEERRAARRARRAEREARKKEAEARGETYEPPKKQESERSQPTSATTIPEVKPTPVQNTTKVFERERHHVAAGAMDELD